jgi:hypothetical protein
MGLCGSRRPGRIEHPGDQGHRRQLIYLVDRWRGKNGAHPGDIGDIGFYDVDFEALPGIGAQEALDPPGFGLTYIDHLTHNVHRGRMAEWSEFYERLFNFREVRYFDIEGQATGVKSKAMTSPCGKIRIPINEEGNEKAGQIQEYLDKYRGEGIQHIALGSRNLYDTVDALQMAGMKLLNTSETYYELLPRRIPALTGGRRRAATAQHPGRRPAGRAAAADLQREPAGAHLLRVHPAQGQRGLRRGQLQGALRDHGTGPDAARRAGRQAVLASWLRVPGSPWRRPTNGP